VLEVVNLTKRYGESYALNDVSLSIEQGTFTTILGPSGSGKSTLLMSIAGFVDPTAGDIRLNGRSLLPVPPERRNFGIVFQGYALFPHLSVRDNVAFPLRMRRLSSAETERRVSEALALVQLQDYADRFPRQLSGGQQQRVALARALVFKPALVLLDEPLSALDKGLREALRGELRRLHRKGGMTFVLVTHDQDEALELSDRVAIINKGRLEQCDDPVTLYNAPKTRFVAEFLGKSNFIPVRKLGVDGAVVRLQAGGVVLEHEQAGDATGAEAVLVLRPERIQIAPEGAPVGPNAVRGVVEETSFRGAEISVTVRTEIGTLLARAPSAHPFVRPAPGDRVVLHWMRKAGYLLDSADGTEAAGSG